MLNLMEIGIYGYFWINVSIIECVINLFFKFFCFVVVYILEIKICNVECIDVDKFLEKLIFVSFEMNIIVFFCVYNKGMFVFLFLILE